MVWLIAISTLRKLANFRHPHKSDKYRALSHYFELSLFKDAVDRLGDSGSANRVILGGR